MFLHRKLINGLLGVLFIIYSSLAGYAQYNFTQSDSVWILKADSFYESGSYDSVTIVYEEYLRQSTQKHDEIAFSDKITSETDNVKYLTFLLKIATSYNLISSPDMALSILNYALADYAEFLSEDPGLRSLFCYQKGNALLLQMEYTGAVNSYKNALISGKPDCSLQQRINQNLGGIFFFLEDYDKALEHYQEALLSCTGSTSENPLKMVELLTNIGNVYSEINDFPAAMEYYRRAEQLLQGMNKMDKDYARLSLNLGKLFLKMNDYQSAIDYFRQASDLFQRNLRSNSEEKVMLSANMAGLYQSRKMYDSTIFFLNLAVFNLPPEKSDRNLIAAADLHRQMGEIYGLQKNWDTALDYHEKALNDLEKLSHDPQLTVNSEYSIAYRILAEFRIKFGRAKAMLMLGKEENNKEIFLQSFSELLFLIEMVKKINEEFGREGSRLVFNESVKDLYYTALEAGYFLMQDDHPDISNELLLIMEKSRNKILLSSIIGNIARYSSDIPDSLLHKAEFLNEQIALCLRNLWADPAVNEKGSRDHYLFYLNSLLENRRQLDSLTNRFQRTSELFAKMKEQDPVKGYPFLKQSLEDNEALIEYFVGDTSLFIIVAKTDGLDIRKIPVLPGFKQDISLFSNEIRLAGFHSLHSTGYDLYSKLILPVLSSLTHVDKLIIIPDEILSTVPFEALIAEPVQFTGRSAYQPPVFLIDSFEVIYHFSSTLWLNSGHEPRPVKKNHSYAGIAPVQFSKEGDNVSLPSLPFSEKEIKEVAELIGKDGGKADLFIGYEATPQKLREILKENDIVHVATHSVIREDQPGLSGLILSSGVKKDEKSVSNDMVFLNEIYNFRISADLLALSACATGTGKITRSEGVLAMTRGFYTAGASNIIYTLWNVTDRHSKDFMVAFFKGILAGKSYSSALRNAKLEMIKKPETSLPRIWAPYVLLGTY